MVIGLPKEIKADENRVALTPDGVKSLVASGHKVIVQQGAGEGSGFEDREYADAGAHLEESIASVYEAADLIVKVKEPIEAEYDLLKKSQILFTYLHLAADRRLTEVLMQRKVTAFAYETLEDHGKLVLLEPMSEVAGKMAALNGALHLAAYNGGSGRLLGGVVGTQKNNVLILGGGTVGAAAAKVAAAMGANVTILNRGMERLRYLAGIMPENVTMRVSNEAVIRSLLPTADLVIGTVLVPGAKAPKLVDYEMLKTMQKGSVIVDVSIDQGGCIETSRPTTHSKPTYEVEGVIHYCVANMPGAYPRTSTLALTSVTLSYIMQLANEGVTKVLESSGPMRTALNTFEGKVTNKAVKAAFGLQ